MVKGFFMTCHIFRDLLIDELIFVCNGAGVGEAGAGQ